MKQAYTIFPLISLFSCTRHYVILLAVFLLADSGSGLAAVTLPAQSARYIRLMDNGWKIHRVPKFHRWKPRPFLTASQLMRLHCPGPHAAWTSVQLPDDYIVAGKFANADHLMGTHGSLPLYPAWYRRIVVPPKFMIMEAVTMLRQEPKSPGAPGQAWRLD